VDFVLTLQAGERISETATAPENARHLLLFVRRALAHPDMPDRRSGGPALTFRKHAGRLGAKAACSGCLGLEAGSWLAGFAPAISLPGRVENEEGGPNETDGTDAWGRV
jgi:hypothetical protein